MNENLFMVSIIFITIVTIIAILVLLVFVLISSTPMFLHKSFTLSPSSPSYAYESAAIQKKMFTSDVRNSFDVNTAWSLWQLTRMASYLSNTSDTCNVIERMSDYSSIDYVMGVTSSGRQRKMGMVYHNSEKRHTIITFHGTSNPADWRTDIQINQVPYDLEEGDDMYVHKGFISRYRQISDYVDSIIDQYNPVTDDWYVTGHSLGGAISTLVAYDKRHRFSSLPYVYTFGQPRIGNPVLSNKITEALNGRGYRVINSSDIITQLPPSSLFNNQYQHALEEVGFTSTLSTFALNHTQSYNDFLEQK